MKKDKLIFGIGNDILMDDGIGPRVVNKLAEKNAIADVQYHTSNLGGLDVLDFIEGFNQVVFIDAIKTEKGKPGTLYEFTPADFKETLHLSNLHDISFLSAIELGKRIKMKIPEKIYIFAVEIVEDQVFGKEFTPEVDKRFPEIVEEIRNRLNTIWN